MTRPPPKVIADAVAAATGREHRNDPSLPGTGGPAGNTQLTAWLGLVLLVLFAAELTTLLSVRQLISWHIAVGTLLIPPALAKTTTTTWRIVRYYTGHRSYQQSGPPPLLRLLGPLVVLTTLALLGSGIAVLTLGPSTTFTPLLTIAGQQVNALTIHQGATLVWAVATGLHVLSRTIPAIRLAGIPGHGGLRVEGTSTRTVVLILTLTVGVLATVLVLRAAGPWTTSAIPRPSSGTTNPRAEVPADGHGTGARTGFVSGHLALPSTSTPAGHRSGRSGRRPERTPRSA